MIRREMSVERSTLYMAGALLLCSLLISSAEGKDEKEKPEMRRPASQAGALRPTSGARSINYGHQPVKQGGALESAARTFRASRRAKQSTARSSRRSGLARRRSKAPGELRRLQRSACLGECASLVELDERAGPTGGRSEANSLAKRQLPSAKGNLNFKASLDDSPDDDTHKELESSARSNEGLAGSLVPFNGVSGSLSAENAIGVVRDGFEKMVAAPMKVLSSFTGREPEESLSAKVEASGQADKLKMPAKSSKSASAEVAAKLDVANSVKKPTGESSGKLAKKFTKEEQELEESEELDPEEESEGEEKEELEEKSLVLDGAVGLKKVLAGKKGLKGKSAEAAVELKEEIVEKKGQEEEEAGDEEEEEEEDPVKKHKKHSKGLKVHKSGKGALKNMLELVDKDEKLVEGEAELKGKFDLEFEHEHEHGHSKHKHKHHHHHHHHDHHDHEHDHHHKHQPKPHPYAPAPPASPNYGASYSASYGGGQSYGQSAYQQSAYQSPSYQAGYQAGYQQAPMNAVQPQLQYQSSGYQQAKPVAAYPAKPQHSHKCPTYLRAYKTLLSKLLRKLELVHKSLHKHKHKHAFGLVVECKLEVKELLFSFEAREFASIVENTPPVLRQLGELLDLEELLEHKSHLKALAHRIRHLHSNYKANCDY